MPRRFGQGAVVKVLALAMGAIIAAVLLGTPTRIAPDPAVPLAALGDL